MVLDRLQREPDRQSARDALGRDGRLLYRQVNINRSLIIIVLTLNVIIKKRTVSLGSRSNEPCSP